MTYVRQSQQLSNIKFEVGKQEIVLPSTPSKVSMEIPQPTREDRERAFWIIETQVNVPLHEREIERKVWMELHPDKLRVIAERRFRKPDHFNEMEGAENFRGG